LLTYVSFGEELGENAAAENGGMLLDVSASGLAVAAALAVSDGTLLNIAIPADATHAPIHARGRVVWMAESKRRMGVQLLEVSGGNRELLRRWMAAIEGRGIPDDTGGRQATGIAKGVEAKGAVDPAARSVQAQTSVEAERPRPQLVGGLPPAERQLGGGAWVPGVSAQALPVAAPVANEGARSRLGPLVVGGSFVVVVAVSFFTGIAIGRNILGRHGAPREVAASARRAAVAADTPSRGVALTVVESPPPTLGLDTRATSNTATATGTRAIAGQIDLGGKERAAAIAAKQPAEREATDKAGAGATSVGTSRGAAKDAAGEKSPTIGGAEAVIHAPGTGELVIIPNEGDKPLRVELPEELIVQSPSLEIRAQRFAMLPGVPLSRTHRARKERVVIGPMVSRVTPQVPPAAWGSAAGGEQSVSVRATIDGDGHVSYVDPLSGPMGLVPRVMSAVREWKYQASSLDGEGLETEVDLMIKFRAPQ
jgi:hypothetical protein